MDTRIPGFYRLRLPERQQELAERSGFSKEKLDSIAHECLGFERANQMVENCIGVLELPVGLGLNFLINGKDYLIPMATEEPSVIAAVSHIAKLVRACGGFQASADRGVMRAQLQLIEVERIDETVACIQSHREMILDAANCFLTRMTERGGGAIDLEIQSFGPPDNMVVVHLLIDCVDAMGANALNTVAEGVAPLLEQITGCPVNLRILSNLADRRLARAHCAVDIQLLKTKEYSGDFVAKRILSAARLAEIDPYRAATHNKGIMNGIDAVAIATGNDWRSLEAGAHAYAALHGQYRSLTSWKIVDHQLVGQIELPLSVGIVGGATSVHPCIKTLKELMGCQTARELASVMAAVGLAQNLGALKALASEGIQQGHMALHARQVALAAGAQNEQVREIAEKMIQNREISLSAAMGLLNDGKDR